MFVLPLGDEPNPPGTPLLTYALILVNCAAYVFITLPLGFDRPEWADPRVQEYLRAWVEALGEPVSRGDVAAMYLQITEYDLFVYRWGFRAAEPGLATLFTAMFLHAGFLHLLGNMLFLWICGDNVEHRLGRARFLAAYVGTGIAATAFQTLLSGRADAPLLGSSGAIFGLAGLYFVWFPRNRVRLWVMVFPFFMNVVRIPARAVLAFFVLVQNLLPFLVSAGAGAGSDAHGAHLGGFLVGLLAAWVIDRRLRSARSARAGDGGPRRRASAARHHRRPRRGRRLRERGEALRPAVVGRDPRLLGERHSMMLGTWMAAGGHPHAALALFERHVRDHPVSSTTAAAHVAAGLLQMRTFGEPAAARQHLLEALALDPDAETEAQAREGLTEAAALEKFQLNRL